MQPAQAVATALERERMLAESPLSTQTIRANRRMIWEGLQQSAAALDVRHCPLLLEVRERGVEARRVAVLGREQGRPGLGESRSDLGVDSRCAGEVARSREARSREPGIARFRRRGTKSFAEPNPFRLSVTVRRVINFTFL